MWEFPFNNTEIDEAGAILSNTIARQISDWLKSERIIEAKGRSVKPSDIMILVRKRTNITTYIIKALQSYNIPVAGLDRLQLQNELIIQDLLSLAKFTLMPYDNLNLACLLKSPIANMNEDGLFKIAYNRTGSLYENIPSDILHVKNTSPYQFFNQAIATYKTMIVEHMGEEVLDPLDVFLNICLAYEKNHVPSLQSFIKWFEAEDIEIKRNVENSSNKVRVMTVHGAKGLESPIVIIADTNTDPHKKPAQRSQWFLDGHDSFIVWNAPLKETPAICKKHKNNVKEKSLEEYKRLLYVALTRAEDEIYICGTSEKEKMYDDAWYSIALQVFKQNYYL